MYKVEAFEHLLNVESPYRYALIDGVICDMTGSTPEHADLAYNITELLKDRLGKQGPCRVYQGQYIAIPGNPSVVPDVVVSCDVADRDKQKRLKPFRIGSPLIVVEVLSPRTEKYDRGKSLGVISAARRLRSIACKGMEAGTLWCGANYQT